jgi:ankyrin repeat protein
MTNSYLYISMVFLLSLQNAYSMEQPQNIDAAVKTGNLELVEQLLKAGVDSSTALHVAAHEGHLEIVKYFVDNGIIGINAQDSQGQTPLHCAVSKGHLPIVHYLINNGADVHVKTNSGSTALAVAALRDYPEIALCLIRNGATVVNLAIPIPDYHYNYTWSYHTWSYQLHKLDTFNKKVTNLLKRYSTSQQENCFKRLYKVVTMAW